VKGGAVQVQIVTERLHRLPMPQEQAHGAHIAIISAPADDRVTMSIRQSRAAARFDKVVHKVGPAVDDTLDRLLPRWPSAPLDPMPPPPRAPMLGPASRACRTAARRRAYPARRARGPPGSPPRPRGRETRRPGSAARGSRACSSNSFSSCEIRVTMPVSCGRGLSSEKIASSPRMKNSTPNSPWPPSARRPRAPVLRRAAPQPGHRRRLPALAIVARSCTVPDRRAEQDAVPACAPSAG
jgi:hypothetical protein